MNRKLIALAVAGATVVPAAMAQTANPVTLYGRAYLTLESVEAKGTPSLGRRTQLQDQSSMFGIRGTEDLGGGLKAFFQLETVFRLDQTGSSFANRNSGVGLQGGWGSFLMGRWDMPFKTTTIAIDPYGDLTIGGITAALNRDGAVSFDRRDDNVLQYWSPSLGGFAFRLAYQVRDTSPTATHDQGASATFSRGPVYAVLAYEEHKDLAAGGNEKGWALGGSFVAGPVKFGALAEEFKRDGRSSKRKSWLANVVWTAGNHQFIYQYQQSKSGGANGATTQPDCKVHQPGWQYNFSRRTFFLLQYADVKNNAAAICGANILAVAAGQDPRGYSLGLRHTF